MNSSISQTTWHGQEAWVLENKTLRIVTTPQLGAKLVSLVDKRTGTEWLVGPGQRPFQKVPYGASFTDQDMSGWDEMFPTIVSCNYPAPGNNLGTPLPDHGEVWPLSWSVEQAEPNELSLSVEGVALRYVLTRTLTFQAADTLYMHYTLQNLEQERLAYLWSAHPQFFCGGGAQFILPDKVKEVCNSIPAEYGWGEPETRFTWPEATAVTGQRVRIDYIGAIPCDQARKFFVPPEMPVGWAGLVRQTSEDWLRLAWDAGQLPYLGLWIDEGKFSQEVVASLEPMTGYYDSLATAWEKQRVTLVEPGESRSWSLAMQLGTGELPFPIDEQLI